MGSDLTPIFGDLSQNENFLDRVTFRTMQGFALYQTIPLFTHRSNLNQVLTSQIIDFYWFQAKLFEKEKRKNCLDVSLQNMYYPLMIITIYPCIYFKGI